jgi:hypothetical protein
MKTKRVMLSTAILAALAILLTYYFLSDSRLRTVSRVMEQYSLEVAVYKQSQKGFGAKQSNESLLSPPYLDKYGLNDKKYLTKDGFYAPNGVNWDSWSTETRVAAILMWADEVNLSAGKIINVMDSVDAYYKRNSKNEPIANIVLASMSK